jgi:hypothetical protein
MSASATVQPRVIHQWARDAWWRLGPFACARHLETTDSDYADHILAVFWQPSLFAEDPIACPAGLWWSSSSAASDIALAVETEDPTHEDWQIACAVAYEAAITDLHKTQEAA